MDFKPTKLPTDLTQKEIMNLPEEELTKMVIYQMVHDFSCGELCAYCNKNIADGIRVVFRLELPKTSKHKWYKPTVEEKEYEISLMYLEIAGKQKPKKLKDGEHSNRKLRDDTGAIKTICNDCKANEIPDDSEIYDPIFVSYFTYQRGNHKH